MPRRKSLSANRSPEGPKSEDSTSTAGTTDPSADLPRRETADVLEDEYRSREPSEREIRDLIGTCFLRETSTRVISGPKAVTSLTASRIETLCVPLGWKTFPSNPNTNRDEIPIVLKLRDIFRQHGHEHVDELWFLRVQQTLASAFDALDRARAADDASAENIVTDIKALKEMIVYQRALGD